MHAHPFVGFHSLLPKSMEDKRSKILPKNLFYLVVVVVVMGRTHGSRDDQAQALRSLLRTKRQLESDIHVEGWISLSSSQLESLEGDMEQDLIPNGLPGQPSRVKFKQYAGHVTVDERHGRSLFYYFVEAAQDPSERPLLLWLNGGPGCSSFGYGAMDEIGPFGVNADGETLYLRHHAWNKVANILFLESPVGIGFSYSNTSSDYYTPGDTRTAQDSYIFLVNWFKRFPHYKRRDFFIAGESYAGFYIPELADAIIHQNKKHDSSLVINLKGIMIGNGLMHWIIDMRGVYDYMWSHALISDETHHGLINHCSLDLSSDNCIRFDRIAYKEAGKINLYSIYAPICPNASSDVPNDLRNLLGYDPCSEEHIVKYLNDPHVQQALHVKPAGVHHPWDFCNLAINKAWRDSPSTMFPIYRRLLSVGLQILLYSGDTDAVLPVTSTRYSINELNLTVKNSWQPWIDDGGEVGGYRVVYEGLTLATVRGAGHEVPKSQPMRGLFLFKSFLAGKESFSLTR